MSHIISIHTLDLNLSFSILSGRISFILEAVFCIIILYIVDTVLRYSDATSSLYSPKIQVFVVEFR